MTAGVIWDLVGDYLDHKRGFWADGADVVRMGVPSSSVPLGRMITSSFDRTPVRISTADPSSLPTVMGDR